MKIGEMLVQRKLLSPVQVDKALQHQATYGGRLGTNLVELGLVEEDVLAKVLSEQLHIPAANASDFENIERTALELVSREFVIEHQMVPIGIDSRLNVAISDPADIQAIDRLAFQTGRSVQVFIAPEIWVVAALERYYDIPRPQRFFNVADDETLMPNLVSDISTNTQEQPEIILEAHRKVVPVPSYLRRLTLAENKEDVFDALLDFLGNLFPRLAVFVARKDRFTGWTLRGFPIRLKDFAGINVRNDTESPLHTVVTTSMPFHGEVMKAQAAAMGLETLQVPFGKRIHLYPVLYNERVIATVLGLTSDHRGPIKEKEEAQVVFACRKAGLGLQLLAVKKAILANPS